MPRGWTEKALKTPSPKDMWGRRGCSGVWAAMRQDCPRSSLLRRRETPEVWQDPKSSQVLYEGEVSPHKAKSGRAWGTGKKGVWRVQSASLGYLESNGTCGKAVESGD